LPRLLAAGIDQKTIDQITIKTPARVLTLVQPSA
jgi:predicted metal-dependent phosphotriesterase family hydrolase